MVCAGQGFVLISKADGESISGDVTYTWHESFDGSAFILMDGSAATITVAGTYTYTLTAPTTNDCAAGAENWEAWIQDSVDEQIYRITQFSDNSWWFADDYNRNDKVRTTCDGKRHYSIDCPPCPYEWQTPSIEQLRTRWPKVAEDDPFGGTIASGYAPANNNKCAYTPRYDLVGTGCDNTIPCSLSDANGISWAGCNSFTDVRGRMRCWRTL